MALWDKPGVPHKGWIYVGFEDIAEDCDPDEPIPYEQCEMCGNEKIRYIHILRHPDFEEEMRVGCVCAEKMTEDYETPRAREQSFKNRINRRRNFMKQAWRFNPTKETYTLKYKGEYITIMKSRYGSNWGVYYNHNKIWEYEGKKIKSMDAAKQVAFEVFDDQHLTREEREYGFY